MGWLTRWERFSLAPRERAGVRGDVALRLKADPTERQHEFIHRNLEPTGWKFFELRMVNALAIKPPNNCPVFVRFFVPAQNSHFHPLCALAGDARETLRAPDVRIADQSGLVAAPNSATSCGQSQTALYRHLRQRAAAGNTAGAPARFCSAKTGDDSSGVAAGGIDVGQFVFAGLVAGALVADHAPSPSRKNIRPTHRAGQRSTNFCRHKIQSASEA